MNNSFLPRYAWLFLLLLLHAGVAMGQQEKRFSVVSFEPDQFDQTAKVGQNKRIDGNGSLYAIIKVKSTDANDRLADYLFNFGMMSHEVAPHGDELWVYVQRNAKRVTISRKGYATINQYDLNTTIEEGCTYRMVLSPAPERVLTQMVLFTVQPADSKATVMVRQNVAGAIDDVVGITDESGSAAKPLPYGSYTYRVVAEGYYPVDGRFTLNDESQTQTEQVVLRPRFATITLRTQAGADIYVNGELKGRGSWTGRLNSGSYQVECRQQNHKPSSQAIVVEENKSRTYDLTAPTPITGKLSVLSQPLGATITIDGQQQGVTPKQLPQMFIGRHTIVVAKDGYEQATQQFDVTEGETTNLNIPLKKIEVATTTTTTPATTIDTPIPFTITITTPTTPINNGGSSYNGTDRTFTVKGVSFVMKAVQGGTFQMGSNGSNSNERPIHQVTLSDYMIGETEVTHALWKAVMGSNPSHKRGKDRPVENVSWDDCQTFIEKLNAMTGQHFRLPTEAEWEYAARGGSKSQGYQYSGSNKVDDVAWYGGYGGDKTHDVMMKLANELGIYDMSGNVSEWCQDWFGTYSNNAQTNPIGPISGSNRVFRGGCLFDFSGDCRVATRRSLKSDIRSTKIGLRLAL